MNFYSYDEVRDLKDELLEIIDKLNKKIDCLDKKIFYLEKKINRLKELTDTSFGKLLIKGGNKIVIEFLSKNYEAVSLDSKVELMMEVYQKNDINNIGNDSRRSFFDQRGKIIILTMRCMKHEIKYNENLKVGHTWTYIMPDKFVSIIEDITVDILLVNKKNVVLEGLVTIRFYDENNNIIDSYSKPTFLKVGKKQ